MSFNGFPRKTLTFLKDLKINNDRDWFAEHRSDYEQYYIAPALALIEALAPVTETLDPPHRAEARLNGSLRRIHRDTRFSNDKTPYQTRIHLVFWTGDHPNRSAGIHLVFADDHFGYGAGHWAFEKDAMERYRSAVMDKAKRTELEKAAARAKSVGCILNEPEFARIPRGYNADAASAEWLRRKGIVARTHEAKGHDKRLFTSNAVGYLSGLMTALAPVNRWICKHLETGSAEPGN